MNHEKQLTYSLILHQARRKLQLTLMEYCVADSIYHLSNNPSSEVKGWCYASKDQIAKFLGTTSVTIFGNINNLIKKGLIEKDEETKYLRTTAKWYDNVVMFNAKDDKVTLHPIKNLNSEQ
jgi:DNA-binding MarR family transcriptional regulator